MADSCEVGSCFLAISSVRAGLPAPKPSTGTLKPTPLPAGGDIRSNLMEAIRQAGGAPPPFLRGSGVKPFAEFTLKKQ